MPGPRIAAITAGLLIASATAVAAQQDALRPALSARIAYLDHGGAPLAVIEPDSPFKIDVTLINEVGKDAPRGVELFGWLRRQSVQNLPCQQAARGYLGTGRLSLDAVPLLGPVVGVVATDNSVTVVDPFLDLASANLIGASVLPEQPGGFAADRLGAGFAQTLPKAGELRLITGFGGRASTLARGLDRPGPLVVAEDGAIWVLQQGANRVSRIDRTGTETRGIDNALSLSGDAGAILVGLQDGRLQVISGAGGADLAELPAAAPGATALPLRDAEGRLVAVARLNGSGLAIHYLDAPEAAPVIPLPAAATRLAADPFGLFVFAWDPVGGAVSIVDVARGHVLQGVEADGVAISDVVLTDRAAFLMLADQSMVGAISLAAVGPDSPAPIRRIQLGQPSDERVTGRGMLTALSPRSEVMAIHAETYTGFLLHETNTMGDGPPMASVRLRGGVPSMTAVLDRGFHETAPGRFQTGAILPAAGDFELVLSTGIAGMTLCFPVPGMPTTEAATGPARMTAQIGAAGPDGHHAVRLSFADAKGVPRDLPDGTLSLTALEAGWTRRVRTGADATLQLDLPPLGPFVATVSALDGRDVAPLLFEVTP